MILTVLFALPVILGVAYFFKLRQDEHCKVCGSLKTAYGYKKDGCPNECR